MHDHERTGCPTPEPVSGGRSSTDEDLPRERPVHARGRDDADSRELFHVSVELAEQAYALHPGPDRRMCDEQQKH